MTANLNTRLDKAMSHEQFTQVVDAILNGKYSWACVLILRFAGYNPLHYIPYRTYNRLLKENPHPERSEHGKKMQTEELRLISDLKFLESLEKDYPRVNGGFNADNPSSGCLHFLTNFREKIRS
jgi:hypothetical protein